MSLTHGIHVRPWSALMEHCALCPGELPIYPIYSMYTAEFGYPRSPKCVHTNVSQGVSCLYSWGTFRLRKSAAGTTHYCLGNLLHPIRRSLLCIALQYDNAQQNHRTVENSPRQRQNRHLNFKLKNERMKC